MLAGIGGLGRDEEDGRDGADEIMLAVDGIGIATPEFNFAFFGGDSSFGCVDGGEIMTGAVGLFVVGALSTMDGFLINEV